MFFLVDRYPIWGGRQMVDILKIQDGFQIDRFGVVHGFHFWAGFLMVDAFKIEDGYQVVLRFHIWDRFQMVLGFTSKINFGWCLDSKKINSGRWF